MLRRALLPLGALALLAGGCGDDDGTDDAGAVRPFSVEAMLAELPPVEGAAAVINIGDLDAASEATGLARPEPGDAAALGAWTRALTYDATELDTPVFVPLADLLYTPGDPDGFREELGWDLADVDRFAEISLLPDRFLVATGSFDSATFDEAEVVPIEDGIVTAGEGDDFQADLASRTTARPLGTPLRMAIAGDRLVATPSLEMARQWVAGDGPRLADNERLRVVAARLDGVEGLYGAWLRDLNGSTPSSGADDGPGPRLGAPVQAVGIGWSAGEGGSQIVIVHHWADADEAATQVDAIEQVLAEGYLADGSSYTRRLELDAVVAEGPLTLTTVRPVTPRDVGVPLILAMNNETLFVP